MSRPVATSRVAPPVRPAAPGRVPSGPLLAATFLAVALGAGPARAAPEPPPAAPLAPAEDVEARLAAAALEVASWRMRALVEQAETLERLGRTDEALDVLKRAEEAYREGLSLANDALRRRATAPAPERLAAEPAAPPRGPEAPRALPPADPRDPVALAVRFLVSEQGPYGLWGPYGKGKRQDDVVVTPKSITDTAWAVLALLDAVETDPRDLESGDPVVFAIHWGVRALLDHARPGTWAVDIEADDGPAPVDASAEARVLSAWALAAAYGATGRTEWKAPADAAVREVVLTTTSDPRRWVRAMDRQDPYALVPWVAAALHEARPLDLEAAADVDRALAALAAGVFESSRRDGRRGYAAALVLRAANRPDPPGMVPSLGPSTMEARDGDAQDLLLGTTYHAHASRADDWDLWRETRLEWAKARQRKRGDDAGAWASDPRMGRVRETAMHVLAILVPETPWREPVAGR